MSREDIRKLLGGYATDTLSEAERRALFEAALEDQELFDALAKEQALRDLLQDPAARQHLIAALETGRETFAARAWRWVRRPATLAMATGLASLALVAVLVLRRANPPMRQEAMLADAISQNAPASIPQQGAPTTAKKHPAVRKPAAPVRAEARLDEFNRLESARGAAAPVPQPVPAAAQPPALAAPAASGAPGGGVGGAVAGLHAQNTEQKLAMKAKASPPANPALPYTVLLEGPDGEYAPQPAGTELHAGESVRLQLEPNAAGYLNLYQRDSGGQLNLVETHRVEQGRSYALPSAGSLRSDQPGQLELVLVLSQNEPGAGANTLARGAFVHSSNAPVQPQQTITLVFH